MLDISVEVSTRPAVPEVAAPLAVEVVVAALLVAERLEAPVDEAEAAGLVRLLLVALGAPDRLELAEEPVVATPGMLQPMRVLPGSPVPAPLTEPLVTALLVADRLPELDTVEADVAGKLENAAPDVVPRLEIEAVLAPADPAGLDTPGDEALALADPGAGELLVTEVTAPPGELEMLVVTALLVALVEAWASWISERAEALLVIDVPPAPEALVPPTALVPAVPAAPLVADALVVPVVPLVRSMRIWSSSFCRSATTVVASCLS